MAKGDDGLRSALRGFIAEHRTGWDHHAWQGLLGDLHAKGFVTGETTELGRQLERERILVTLEDAPVKGLGPKRREAIADKYGRLWDLQVTSVEDLASTPSITRQVAEDVLTAIR